MGNVITTYKVAIIEDGASCQITPTEVLAKVGDEIVFYNLTDVSVTVLIPEKKLFNETNFEIKKGAHSPAKTVQAGVELGGYAYSAGTKKGLAHASIPRIIIYDNIP